MFLNSTLKSILNHTNPDDNINEIVINIKLIITTFIVIIAPHDSLHDMYFHLSLLFTKIKAGTTSVKQATKRMINANYPHKLLLPEKLIFHFFVSINYFIIMNTTQKEMRSIN